MLGSLLLCLPIGMVFQKDWVLVVSPYAHIFVVGSGSNSGFQRYDESKDNISYDAKSAKE